MIDTQGIIREHTMSNQLWMDAGYDREMLIWDNCVIMQKTIDHNCNELSMCIEWLKGMQETYINETLITQWHLTANMTIILSTKHIYPYYVEWWFLNVKGWSTDM